MPGLFGIIYLERGPTRSRSDMSAVFARMAGSLRHHDDDRLDQAGDPDAGLIVGRIGLPHLNPISFPGAREGDGERPKFFISGRLIEGGPDTGAGRLPEAAALCRWRGFFSAVLNDPRHKRSLVVVDRRASVPVFYARSGDWLLFAPEVKALLVDPSVRREVNSGSVAKWAEIGSAGLTVRCLEGEAAR